jgi:hypothetical protein
MANYSGSRIVNCTAKNGDTLQDHNFCQESPGTEILVGLSGLTFIECNLVNCKLPVGSVIQHCNTAQIDRCSHNHDFLSYQCGAECRHMVGKEDITVDGVVVDTLYSYEDILVGG